jgi:hypothetical protein
LFDKSYILRSIGTLRINGVSQYCYIVVWTQYKFRNKTLANTGNSGRYFILKATQRFIHIFVQRKELYLNNKCKLPKRTVYPSYFQATCMSASAVIPLSLRLYAMHLKMEANVELKFCKSFYYEWKERNNCLFIFVLDTHFSSSKYKVISLLTQILYFRMKTYLT